MNEQHILVGCGLRSYKILLIGDSGLQQTFVHETIFLGREDMRADGEVVIIAINQLEREHGGRREEPSMILEWAALPCTCEAEGIQFTEEGLFVLQGFCIPGHHADYRRRGYATETAGSFPAGGMRSVDIARHPASCPGGNRFRPLNRRTQSPAR